MAKLPIRQPYGLDNNADNPESNVPRGRGRPRGRTSNNKPDTAPETTAQRNRARTTALACETSESNVPRGRGRPRGRTNNNKPAAPETSGQRKRARTTALACETSESTTPTGRTRGRIINQSSDHETTITPRKRGRSYKSGDSETTIQKKSGRARGRTNNKAADFSEDTSAAKEPETTSNEPRRTSENPDAPSLEFDCLIEGHEQFFEVNRKLLSDKSNGFKTLSDVNSEEVIEIEGIPDRTLQLAFEFCHTSELEECSDGDACSLLYFADAWEMPELKALLEQRLIANLKPSNTVAFAIAAKSAKLEELRDVCKYSILGILETGENVDGYEKLDEEFKAEINNLLKKL